MVNWFQVLLNVADLRLAATFIAVGFHIVFKRTTAALDHVHVWAVGRPFDPESIIYS